MAQNSKMIGAQSVAPVEMQPSWMRWFEGEADSATALNTPFAANIDFIPQNAFEPSARDRLRDDDGDVQLLSRSIQEGGRIFLPGRQGGRWELWPLFSGDDADSATATLQMFSFSPLSEGQVEKAHIDARQYLVYPSASPYSKTALGPAYPIMRDDDGNPETLTVSSSGGETQHFEFGDTGIVVPTPYGNDYVSGPRHIFETAGAYAIFPWITNVSAGAELLLLVRAV